MVQIDTVALTDQQWLVRDSIRDICADSDAEYWRSKDEAGEYPREFVDSLADHGWFGAFVPEEYDGAGMTTEEVVVMMEEIAATGGGFGVAREYDVERYFREARLTRLVPITQQLVLNFIGENVLGLPKSY